MPTMKNGLVTSQNQAVMLEKAIVTSANSLGQTPRVNKDPDEINGTSVTSRNRAVIVAKAIETPSNIYRQNTRVCGDPDKINGTNIILLAPPIWSRVSCDPDES